MNEQHNHIPKQTKVAISVLRGATIPNTAKEHRISIPNCKRMVNIYCSISDHSHYNTLREHPYGDFNIPITKLRKYANHFINKSRCNNGQVKITEQSSIWDLSDVQTLTLTALWERNIETVADLLKYDERRLLRLPKLGKIGLQQLKDMLGNYGFSLTNKE